MKTNLLELCKNYNFQKLFAKKGYTYFTRGYYNLNIIGVRAKGNNVTNAFDDVLVVIYNTPTKPEVRRVFPITTDPGLESLKKPVNSNGTAILVPGQYRGCWKLGLHRGKYTALVQRKPVKVYRDKNKDNVYDFNPTTIENGVFGINIHRAGEESIVVNSWSAGCQVFKLRKDFEAFMNLARSQVSNKCGDTFSYTLLTEEDLK